MNGPAVVLHPDWLSDAAARIRQPRLRESFTADARMRARVAARLAVEQGLPEVETNGLNAASRQVIAAFSQDPARLVTLTGLVWNARFLARMVTRDAVARVLGQIDRKDLVFAFKLREFAPAEASFGYEAGGLTPLDDPVVMLVQDLFTRQPFRDLVRRLALHSRPLQNLGCRRLISK